MDPNSETGVSTGREKLGQRYTGREDDRRKAKAEIPGMLPQAEDWGRTPRIVGTTRH